MAQTAQPLSVEPTAIERRFYPRVVPPAPIYISMGEANPCRVLNASENGLLLSTPTEFPRNFVARIALAFNGLPRPAVVNIHVLWANKTQQLAGVQFLEVSDHDRQQIRKWGSYASLTSSHRDTLRETANHQLFTHRSNKNPTTLSLNNPVVAQSTSPLPAVIRRQSTSPIASITRWAMLLAVLCLVGASFSDLAPWSILSHVPPQFAKRAPLLHHPLRTATPTCNLPTMNASQMATLARHYLSRTPRSQGRISRPQQLFRIPGRK